ncbi:MAG: hypothetical protein OCD02_10735 [Spirochaetaceae bacterium]
MDEERKKFIKEREERYDGKIIYSSFAKYVGNSKGNKQIGTSGLFYIINKILYFEDFAPAPSILTMNKKSNYSKLEFGVKAEELKSIREVREQDALNAIKNSGDEYILEEAPKGFWRFFSQSLIEIKTNNRPTMYFDCLKNDEHKNEILKYINL